MLHATTDAQPTSLTWNERNGGVAARAAKRKQALLAHRPEPPMPCCAVSCPVQHGRSAGESQTRDKGGFAWIAPGGAVGTAGTHILDLREAVLKPLPLSGVTQRREAAHRRCQKPRAPHRQARPGATRRRRQLPATAGVHPGGAADPPMPARRCQRQLARLRA